MNAPARKNSTGWTAPTHRLDSFFNQVFQDMDRAMGASVASMTRGGLPIALWEDEGAYHVEVEVPGVAESDIDATVHDGHLILRVERKAEDGRAYLVNGRTFGKFERTIALPEAVLSDEVQGQLKDGVLHLTLPKTPAVKPKKIAIQTS